MAREKVIIKNQSGVDLIISSDSGRLHKGVIKHNDKLKVELPRNALSSDQWYYVNQNGDSSLGSLPIQQKDLRGKETVTIVRYRGLLTLAGSSGDDDDFVSPFAFDENKVSEEVANLYAGSGSATNF